MCTWSCNDDDMDPKTCPSGGVCAFDVGGIDVGTNGNGMCFRSCTTSADCAEGMSCASANASTDKVCAPVPPDAIAGTIWQSNTITATAKSNGVQTSTYTMTFGAEDGFANGMAQGAFTATLVQVYSDSIMYTYPGCTETTTYGRAVWNDRPPAQQPGNLDITNAASTTNRTGCKYASDNTSNEPNDYAISPGTAGYYLSGDTMTIGGGYGSLPYGDSVNWTFTKQ